MALLSYSRHRFPPPIIQQPAGKTLDTFDFDRAAPRFDP
jgi:hypothetical protein